MKTIYNDVIDIVFSAKDCLIISFLITFASAFENSSMLMTLLIFMISITMSLLVGHLRMVVMMSESIINHYKVASNGLIKEIAEDIDSMNNVKSLMLNQEYLMALEHLQEIIDENSAFINDLKRIQNENSNKC